MAQTRFQATTHCRWRRKPTKTDISSRSLTGSSRKAGFSTSPRRHGNSTRVTVSGFSYRSLGDLQTALRDEVARSDPFDVAPSQEPMACSLCPEDAELVAVVRRVAAGEHLLKA